MADPHDHIAVCFFGITRSLRRTIGSIEKHVLRPARARGRVTVHAHLFRQGEIDNPRSGEAGKMDTDAHALLCADTLELEEPDLCLGPMGFETLKAQGDSWEDGFRSLRNILHQLHSLDRVTAMAQDSGAGTVIFVRPDLMYHDSMSYALRAALRSEGPAAWLPGWQPWDGVNDRFAILCGQTAIAAYGQRGRAAVAFCKTTGKPLHGERLLAWSLERADVAQHDIDVYASRVRLDGSVAPQDVFPGAPRRFASHWARRLGIKPAIRTILRGR